MLPYFDTRSKKIKFKMIRYIFYKNTDNTFYSFSVLSKGAKEWCSRKKTLPKVAISKKIKDIKTNISSFSTIPAKILAPFHWCQFHRQLCHYDQPFYDQNLANKLRTVFGIRQLFGSKDQASIEPMRQFAGYDPNHQSSGLELFWENK